MFCAFCALSISSCKFWIRRISRIRLFVSLETVLVNFWLDPLRLRVRLLQKNTLIWTLFDVYLHSVVDVYYTAFIRILYWNKTHVNYPYFHSINKYHTIKYLFIIWPIRLFTIWVIWMLVTHFDFYRQIVHRCGLDRCKIHKIEVKLNMLANVNFEKPIRHTWLFHNLNGFIAFDRAKIAIASSVIADFSIYINWKSNCIEFRWSLLQAITNSFFRMAS